MAVSGGILGGIEGTTTTYKSLYRPAAGVLATVAVRVCNRAAATRTFRIFVLQAAGADPTPTPDGQTLVYDTVLNPAGDVDDKDKFEYSGIVLQGSNNDQIVVYVSGVDVDFTCQGVTEA